MEQIIETERLHIRPFVLEDAPFIIALTNSPGWIEFIGDRNIKTEEQAHAYLENGPMKSYEVNGYGLSMVELKQDKTPIGMCGIINRDTLEHPDIGFALLPEFMGQGYADEMAHAVMEHAEEELKLPVVLAITLPNNTKSIRLLEKIGLRFVQPFRYPDSTEELLLYKKQRAE